MSIGYVSGKDSNFQNILLVKIQEINRAEENRCDTHKKDEGRPLNNVSTFTSYMAEASEDKDNNIESIVSPIIHRYDTVELSDQALQYLKQTF